jgi:hypothetical protein
MTIPTTDAEPERYRGRPLLIVLENYVLAAIGELSDEKRAGIAEVVQRGFGGGSDWMATVRERLHINDSLDEQLRTMWAKNQDIARANGTILHPIQFARMVADTNWASLIGEPLK